MSKKLDLDKELEQDTMEGVDEDEWVSLFANLLPNYDPSNISTAFRPIGH